MVDWAEEHGEIPNECYGSHKGHQAIDVAVNRCLTLDLFHQKWIPGSILSADASNCYNCLAHNMTSLACQCLAMAVEVLVCLLMTIQMMVYSFGQPMVTLLHHMEDNNWSHSKVHAKGMVEAPVCF